MLARRGGVRGGVAMVARTGPRHRAYSLGAVSHVGLILAAGAGRRFGDATKQLAELRGAAAARARARRDAGRATGLERVVVVLGHDADAIRARVDFAAAEVVIAEDWDDGQAASLRRGLEAAGDADAVVVTLGDQPFITPEVIAAALEQLDGHDAVGRSTTASRGIPVVLGPAVLAAAGELRGDQGARELLARFNVRRWDASHLADAVDVDTPEELQAL